MALLLSKPCHKHPVVFLLVKFSRGTMLQTVKVGIWSCHGNSDCNFKVISCIRHWLPVCVDIFWTNVLVPKRIPSCIFFLMWYSQCKSLLWPLHESISFNDEEASPNSWMYCTFLWIFQYQNRSMTIMELTQKKVFTCFYASFALSLTHWPKSVFFFCMPSSLSFSTLPLPKFWLVGTGGDGCLFFARVAWLVTKNPKKKKLN
jgi:hypothetical protein